MTTDDSGTPRIIQGGMGVAISSWPLARAVSRTGQLGVVSGTALEIVCARRLQQGDPGGHVRRALAHFPLPGAADRILRTYYVPDGKTPRAGYRPVPRFTLNPSAALRELTIAANFVEVFLAKENHDGPVGINYLRKIELPIPFACYGAMLAGVDHVLMGAGNPADLPLLLDRLARHEPVTLPVRVQGATSADGDFAIHFDPRDLAIDDRPVLRRPRFDAIVASVDLATALAADPTTRPDGFVVEGHSAGGHNAPPRGPRRLDAQGQPLYDDRDIVEPRQMAGIGLPFWMAGSYGTPSGLTDALAGGAAGVQVGTAFALCRESGMADEYKYRLLDQAARGQVDVRTDARVSPTGFPFKVAQLAGTLSDEQVYADRQRVCDLGVLRSAYRKPDGTIGYRCPSEPTAVYQRHGGRPANTVGRRCLCNALLATADFAQQRPSGYTEPAIVTTGADYTAVHDLIAQLPAGDRTYTAQAVVSYLLGDQTL
ncbi:NAD(P)H-dependent flavin oxidoreductase YrpB (nitropropane dioxygenase family) [Amycolatopsis lexingtonensis]|uniref:NAD(P)H-dependent flavin oxidoreductase YrpB (Nitropropane dioxygenase family) n=1 Tax=Amycolatopsis lexingtonensis TaxID=218822 RepID=A0ABR9I323_9PSEU|nr:nitronate monooxygenase [Amycolatopsis lexingtonensis]MBE1497584.1 NAD(P)H-dependent flavin oxidoreductase YrpB (nitropropane dioxygenase family) [Amycolatopsis lexingtonensis]